MNINDIQKQRIILKKKIMTVKWSDPVSYLLSLQKDYRDLLNDMGKLKQKNFLKQRNFKINKILKNGSNKTRC